MSITEVRPAATHTPEPWCFEVDCHGRGRIRGGGMWLATTWNAAGQGNGDPVLPAIENARLMAAAPDLLSACKARVRLSSSAPTKDRWQVIIGDTVESGHDSRQNARKRIKAIKAAAIAKAERGE